MIIIAAALRDAAAGNATNRVGRDSRRRPRTNRGCACHRAVLDPDAAPTVFVAHHVADRMRSERGKEIATLAIRQRIAEVCKLCCVDNDQAGFARSGLVEARSQVSRPATRSEPTGRVTSTKADIAEGPRAKPIRPAPPITTIFIANAYSSVTGRWSSHGCATRRDARLFPGASDRKPKRKNSQTARHPGRGFPRLAQNGLYDRDNHVRKSRSQCTDPDAGHSRDDRGRHDGAHRDADTPKAIGITLIDAVCDQHHPQP